MPRSSRRAPRPAERNAGARADVAQGAPRKPRTRMEQGLAHDLAGQHALVTGASSGIGRAVASGLAAAGAAVAVNYHGNQDAAEALVHEIERAGGRAIVAGGDISSEAHVEAMFRRCVEIFGTLDIVVANAGIQQDAAIGDMTLERWNRVLAVNLTGQFLCARAAVREFRRRGPRPAVSRALGKIICMSSV